MKDWRDDLGILKKTSKKKNASFKKKEQKRENKKEKIRDMAKILSHTKQYCGHFGYICNYFFIDAKLFSNQSLLNKSRYIGLGIDK